MRASASVPVPCDTVRPFQILSCITVLLNLRPVKHVYAALHGHANKKIYIFVNFQYGQIISFSVSLQNPWKYFLSFFAIVFVPKEDIFVQ